MQTVLYGMFSHALEKAENMKLGKDKTKQNTNNLTFSSAADKILQSVVAVRKVTKPFGSSILAKRALREIKLLRYLRHENVRSLILLSIYQKS